MFKISKRVDYAIQFIQALSKQKEGNYLSLRVFSVESNISFLFLQKIVRVLKAAGIVGAAQGPHGGYYLSVASNAITLKMVVDAIEEGYGVVACQKPDAVCLQEDGCSVKPIFEKMNKQILTYMEDVRVVV